MQELKVSVNYHTLVRAGDAGIEPDNLQNPGSATKYSGQAAAQQQENRNDKVSEELTL